MIFGWCKMKPLWPDLTHCSNTCLGEWGRWR